jgi:hypothetical protein
VGAGHDPGRGMIGPSVILLVALALAAFATPAVAELYQWTDASGVRYYTSDPDSIPEVYRPSARDIGSPRPREALPVETRRDADPGVMPFGGGAPIVAAVEINGAALRLIVDTGADRTMISPAAVARAGLNATGGQPVQILGVTGSAVGSELVVPQMDVAGARVGPLRVVVHEATAGRADGLLGRDVLDFFTLTIDSTAGRAILKPR